MTIPAHIFHQIYEDIQKEFPDFAAYGKSTKWRRRSKMMDYCLHSAANCLNSGNRTEYKEHLKLAYKAYTFFIL